MVRRPSSARPDDRPPRPPGRLSALPEHVRVRTPFEDARHLSFCSRCPPASPELRRPPDDPSGVLGPVPISTVGCLDPRLSLSPCDGLQPAQPRNILSFPFGYCKVRLDVRLSGGVCSCAIAASCPVFSEERSEGPP